MRPHPIVFNSFRESAKQGYPLGQYNLALLFKQKKVSPQPGEDMIELFKESAEQGETYAQYQLGCFLERGDGIPKNISEAIKWYERAAEQGDEDCLKKLKELE